MPSHCMIYVTASTRDEAMSIARTLVAERLVACANVLGEATSVYQWQGKVEEAQEIVLIAKTRRDLADRALARSICAEMHAGFSELRQQMPMNIEASLPGVGWTLRVQDDIDRIVFIWSSLRERFAAQGPFLFGAFSAADAFFAPVVSRFTTHGVALPAVCEAYRQAILALPAMGAWTERALAEHHFVPEDEPYRRPGA